MLALPQARILWQQREQIMMQQRRNYDRNGRLVRTRNGSFRVKWLDCVASQRLRKLKNVVLSRRSPGHARRPQARQVVARLQKLADIARADLGDKLTKTKGAGVRPAAKLQKGDARLSW